MKKSIAMAIVVTGLLVQVSSVFALTTWDFTQRTKNGVTAPWGYKVYDDENGNSNVWRFMYGPDDSSNPSQYKTDFRYDGYINGYYWHASPSGSSADSIWEHGSASIRMDNWDYDIILAFVSPVTAVFDIHLDVSQYFRSGDGQTVYLQIGNQVATSLTVLADQRKQRDYQLSLNEGDILYLRVTENVGPQNDHLYLNAYTLTADLGGTDEQPVPEPASIALLGLGVAGLIRKIKK